MVTTDRGRSTRIHGGALTRFLALNQRYAACAALTRNGIEIVGVGDPAGARFHAVSRRLLTIYKNDDGGHLDGLVSAVKALNWRRITQPQPLSLNPDLRELGKEVSSQAARLRGAIAEQELLDELAAAAVLLTSTSSPVGPVLLRSIEEVGAESCVVIAASKRATMGLETWLQEYGVRVLTAGELERSQSHREQSYVIGPPRIYRSSLVTAPVTSEMSFLLPAWFRDRSVPHSAIAAYAEGAIRVKSRVFTVGDVTEPVSSLTGAEDEVCLPQPVWGSRQSDVREPTPGEVEAHKVILSSNLAIWLDDGERIRSLDPRQPRGERVTYTDVTAVRKGTYLLLRQGTTERGSLYQAAIVQLGPIAADIEAAQFNWKQTLAQRLRQHGHSRVVEDLRAAGIKTADRARAWTDPFLVRPNNVQDFEGLLQWLGIPVHPTFGYATRLRKTIYLVSAEIGKQLEDTVAVADLSELETVGHLRLDTNTEGFRGIIATRVVAISPFTEIVSRHEARVPFEDRSGRWLE